MIENKRSLIPGFLFIVVGLLLFARRIFDFSPQWSRAYPVLFVLFALFLFVESFRRKHTGTLFWGAVFFVLGSFFFLRNFEIIPYFHPDEYWPIFLLAMGLGFLALFIFRPREWGVLIPAGLLLFFGIGFAMRTFHGYFWGWDRFIEDYWPVVLILIGVGVFMSSLLHKPKE